MARRGGFSSSLSPFGRGQLDLDQVYRIQPIGDATSEPPTPAPAPPKPPPGSEPSPAPPRVGPTPVPGVVGGRGTMVTRGAPRTTTRTTKPVAKKPAAKKPAPRPTRRTVVAKKPPPPPRRIVAKRKNARKPPTPTKAVPRPPTMYRRHL